MAIKEGQPPNFDQLKNDANNYISWRTRLAAVIELSQWKSRQSIEILSRRMINDDVFKVQEAAFLGLKAFGEKVKLPQRRTGNILAGINKQLATLKYSLVEGHSFNEFKDEFRKRLPVEFDVHEGGKEEKFDSWLENVWQGIPKK